MKDFNLQRDFFDISENQYSPDLILKPPFHTQLELEAIQNRLNGLSKGLIMDFGAGSGRVTFPLLQNGYSIVAVDVSKKSLFNLRSLARKFKYMNLKTAEKIPDGIRFQTIVGADILHHINMDKYLPIFYKSLIKGGKIIFSEPGAFNPSWYIYLPIASKWSVEKEMMSCTYFNLKSKLKKNGYKNIKITGLGIIPRPFLNFLPPLCVFNDNLGNIPILKLFAYRYIVEASK